MAAAGGCGVEAGVTAGTAVFPVWACSAGRPTARENRRAEAFNKGRRFFRVRTITSTILPKRASFGANCFEKRVEFDREGRGDLDLSLGLGMGEGEMGGVEEVPVELLGA